MKPKILLDCERMKYPKSGLANVCRSLITGFQNVHPDFDMTLYGIPENFPKNHFKILKWRPLQKFLSPDTRRFDLVHVTHQLSEYFHHTGKNQKKVVTLHDLNFLHENLPAAKLRKRVALVQKNIRNADAVVCISDFVKRDFLDNIALFHVKKELLVERIYNGLVFPERRIYLSSKLGYLKNFKFILNIGVLFPKKNQMALLDFLAATDRHLVLVAAASKPAYLAEFQDKIHALNLQNRVHILQDVDEEEKNFLLQNCESYVHPSLAEGFGIPPLEAMYFGKPVFLSTATSLPEIGGESAFYFTDFDPQNMANIYKEKMDLFNSSPDSYRLRLSEHAAQFSADKMASEYGNMYRRLTDAASEF